MTTISHVKCSQCQVPLERSAEPNPESRYSCSVCGVSETEENIMREVGDYFVEHCAAGFDKILSDTARGNKFLKYEGSLAKKVHHRFVIDLETRI